MGFRVNSYAKVWEVKPVTDNKTKIRISISRKDKQSGEYIQDFSGFVDCIGTNTAAKALRLKEGDRIKLGDVDVTTRYDKEKNVTYTNYAMFNFEMDGEESAAPAKQPANEPQPAACEGEVDDDRLPF